MLDFQKLGEQLKAFFGGWPTFIAVGTFLLYLTGYLTTRFYLTVVGVGADLAVLDEQYFFQGAKFVVYLVSTFPILIGIALILLGLAGLGRRLFGSKQTTGTNPPPPAVPTNRTALAIVGIILALIMIQIVMRKCFLLSNVLVAERLPDPGLGLRQLLLDENDENTSWYFMGLVAGTLVTAGIWLYVRKFADGGWLAKLAVSILGLLVLIQFLFLPINYGVFVQGRFLPRVADLGDGVPLPQGQVAWLVWEGKSTYTYLVQEPPPKPVESPTPANTPSPSPSPSPSPKKCKTPVQRTSAAQPTPTPVVQASPGVTAQPSPEAAPTPAAPFGRRLVSIPQKDLKRIVIIKYDPIMNHIFSH